MLKDLLNMFNEVKPSRLDAVYQEVVLKGTLDGKPFMLPEDELKRILRKVEDGEERFKRYFDQGGEFDF